MKLRRTMPEPRLEMTPLLDVVFLLLTFFALSLVLLVRAEVMGVSLPALGDAEPMRNSRSVTIAVDAAGTLRFEGESVTLEALPQRVGEALNAEPPPRLLLAIDTEGRSGRLIEVVGTLRAAGITNFEILGRFSGGAGENTGQSEGPEPGPF